MASDIVYERDYREVHKIMSARTFTEEKEEAFLLALQIGVYISIGERIHELPHVLNPIKKAAYEKCLVMLEKYAGALPLMPTTTSINFSGTSCAFPI